MTGYLRRAGSAQLVDGASLAWTMADGRRGRRWRAIATLDGRITHALLLEVGLDGLVDRLELGTPGGLLTLHPDTRGTTLHGNVVTPTGVRHLSFAWSPDHAIAVIGRPIADAVTAHRFAQIVRVGEGQDVQTVAIGPDLSIDETVVRFERVSDDAWRLIGPGGDRTMRVDPRGIPVLADGADEWPLELDDD